MVAAEAQVRESWVKHVVTSYGAAVGDGAVEYLDPQLHVIKGHAAQIVPTLARQLGADLIVMGTIARTGIAGFFMGNTAETILSAIDCSVLTVKPPGFISPIALEY